MKNAKALNEALVFIGLTLGASFFVFWGPLALFKVPTISFVSVEKGPVWAILLFILGGFVPSLAGLFLTWRTEGAAGLRRLGRRMIQFNIGWRGYLAAVGLVLFATLCQILIINLMGQSFDATVFLAQLGSFLPLLILGPLSEELGWRGYALDRLQARFSPLVSSVLLGSAWAVWHLPLFFMPGTSQHELGIPFVPFFFTILGLTVLFTWQHNATGGSLWTAIFFHWIYTYASQTVSSGVIQYPIYHWFGTIPYLLAALLVIAFWKPAKAPSAEVSPQVS